MSRVSNQPDVVNPAMALWLAVEDHWRRAFHVRVILFITVCVLLTSCTGRDTGCDVMSMNELRSPDWAYVSTVWSIFCYDTTGFTPMAHLRRAGERRPEVGNLLVGCPGDRITATWTGTNQLLVEYWTRELYRHPPAVTNIGGVTVSFKRRFDE
jgi:hypothetical protein